MVIVDRSTSLVEEAGAIQEITKARALEAVSPPLDLGRRATPRLTFEYRPGAFREFAVEACIVGDDDRVDVLGHAVEIASGGAWRARGASCSSVAADGARPWHTCCSGDCTLAWGIAACL